MDAEIWKLTHHPAYEVSNLGRVRSWAKGRWGLTKGRRAKPLLLARKVDRDGYPLVSLGAGDNSKVHQLVATAFLGPRPLGQEVRHKDDDPSNACAVNLEYGTRRDNILDSLDRKRWGHAVTLTPNNVRRIRQLLGRVRQVDIAAQFGVSQCAISHVARKRTWSHV